MMDTNSEEESKFRTGSSFINSISQEMLWLPHGTFRMGDVTGTAGDEAMPLRMVELSGYHLSATVVTQCQWEKVMGDNPDKPLRKNFPFNDVSWLMAIEFCRRLTAKEDAAGMLPKEYAYTLPTEAQWEYACRAGSEGDYAGDLEKMAWFRENSIMIPHAVAEKMPNAWGFYDMHGNLCEWCLDWYQDDYEGLETENPRGPSEGDSRSVRGGAFWSHASECCSASRDGYPPYSDGEEFGFRVALCRISRSLLEKEYLCPPLDDDDEDDDSESADCPYCKESIHDGGCEHVLAVFGDDRFMGGAAEKLWHHFYSEACEENEDDLMEEFSSACSAGADSTSSQFIGGECCAGSGEIYWAEDTEKALVIVAKALKIFE